MIVFKPNHDVSAVSVMLVICLMMLVLSPCIMVVVSYGPSRLSVESVHISPRAWFSCVCMYVGQLRGAASAVGQQPIFV